MSNSAQVRDLLAALTAVMRSRRTRWYLFGAQAVMVWGQPRMSADVDVTAELQPDQALDFVATMKAAGFELRVRDAEEFVARTRVLPFLHLSSDMPLDVVLAGPGLEELFLDRAVEVELDDLKVPVISPADLIVSKILAGRPKDLDDVRGILRERLPSLDLDRVRETLSLLEQALGQSDLTPAFEAELRTVSP